ncbi:MAG: hypothetical protein JXX14_10105 [Deltaproteobacteria bacterium]|nr:hypothetical protein [Deltaproteobacteria bacterium]
MTSLSLYRNPNVSDITEVSELAQLTSLDLGWTSVAEIPGLQRLTELQTIYMTNTNQLISFHGLHDLPNLATITIGPALSLDHFGIAAVSSLPSLTSLDLIGVNVHDLSYLVENDDFATGDVLNLYVGADTVASCEPALLNQLNELKDRGVDVTANCDGFE